MKEILTLLILLTNIAVFGQQETVSTDFTPIYFEQDSVNIESKWSPKLDSIGQFLSSHPELQLQVHGYANPLEKDFFETVLNRAKNVLKYLTEKYDIQTHEYILTNTNNRGFVPLTDEDYTEKHKAEKRKVEFIIRERKSLQD